MSGRRKKTLKLNGRLDSAAAAQLRQDLIARRGADLAVDAGGVASLGAMSAQVLLAAAQAWRQDGRALTIATASASFSESLRLLGMTADLRAVKD